MNKKLGQHFLKNKAAIKKIISALDLQPGDAIIEIGPGSGALTFPILEKCKNLNCKIIAIEKDEKLAQSIQRLADSKNLEIVIDDALKFLPKLTKNSNLKAKNYKVVGNIPYYITGKLLRILSELESKPKATILMIQKEVANRITAKEGEMNLLAAAIQLWAEPKILFTLNPDDFNPPPKVESAVIQLIPKPEAGNKDITEDYYRLIKIVFKQPRKTLINNLKEGTGLAREELEGLFLKLKIGPKSRPQDLSVEKIKKLAMIINK